MAPDREFCESEVRGKYKKPLHLLVVRVGNSLDLGPAWPGRRPCGGRDGGCNVPIGEEIGVTAATTGDLLNTARSDGIEFQKKREELPRA